MESGDCGNGCDFINLRELQLPEAQGNDDTCEVSLKKSPRRVIHFSDGTIEEFSSDDEVDKPAQAYTTGNEVNMSKASWGPWFWYQTLNVGEKSLEVCDYLGECLASFFGITTPKYQYEIDEYNRMVTEEEERKKKEDEEMAGWTEAASKEDLIKQPEISLHNDTNKF